jgi:hypothetical protein
MSYFVAPLNRVKQNFPEFAAEMAALEAGVRTRAEKIWPGFTFGGMQPGANQYGLANFLPRHISIPRGFGSVSFLQRFNAPGSWTNILSYTVPSNQVHGYAGFAFIGPTMIFNALRLQLSDIVLPIIEIEEARGWDPVSGIVLIIKTDPGQELIIQDTQALLLKGFAERGTLGFNMRVVPIGEMAYRARDDLISLSAPSC